MIACELNTDDVFDFDLNTQSSLILAGQDPSIFEVTYHTSLADAQDGMRERKVRDRIERLGRLLRSRLGCWPKRIRRKARG